MMDEMPWRLVVAYGLLALLALALAAALWRWVIRDSPRRQLERLRARQEEQHRRREERLQAAQADEHGENADGAS